jgi:hypothetical protein
LKTSVSTLRTWMSCPLKAKFKYIDGLPDPNNANAAYGNCIHDALEYYLNTLDVEAAVERFKKTWENPELLDLRIDIWLPRTSYGGFRESGINLIRAYHEKGKWDDRKLIATEHKFAVPIGDHLLSGVVDLLEYYRDKKGRRVLKVVDHKGLALDTPLPTPSGWTTMGDVVEGDLLFGSDGQPCRVIAKSSIHHKKCFELTFNDGSTIICDDDHRWQVESDYGTMVVEARDIPALLFNQTSGQRHLRISNQSGLVLDDVELPIHPYVLGYWLGNGKHTSGEITYQEDDGIEEIIESFGYKLGTPYRNDSKAVTTTILGIRGELNKLGLLGNKHIPSIYMRSSSTQRLDFLRGLLDSDGSWNKVRNQVVFNNTKKELTDCVHELAVSLGFKVSRWEGEYSGFGVKAWVYVVHFTPYGLNPFLMSRKALKAQERIDGTTQSKRRLIKSAKPIESVPTACVSVDSQDNLYLCGLDMIPTHNTGKQPYQNQLTLDIQMTAYWYASLQPEFWMGYDDEKYLGFDDGEMLYNTFAGMDRQVFWGNLNTGKEIDAGERDEKDFLRLYRCIEEVDKAMKAEVYVPNISGDSCNFCPYLEECCAVGPVADKIIKRSN